MKSRLIITFGLIFCIFGYTQTVRFSDLIFKENLAIYHDKPFSGLAIKIIPDGSVKEQISFKNGQKHGYSLLKDNGNIRISQFKNGFIINWIFINSKGDTVIDNDFDLSKKIIEIDINVYIKGDYNDTFYRKVYCNRDSTQFEIALKIIDIKNKTFFLPQDNLEVVSVHIVCPLFVGNGHWDRDWYLNESYLSKKDIELLCMNYPKWMGIGCKNKMKKENIEFETDRFLLME